MQYCARPLGVDGGCGSCATMRHLDIRRGHDWIIFVERIVVADACLVHDCGGVVSGGGVRTSTLRAACVVGFIGFGEDVGAIHLNGYARDAGLIRHVPRRRHRRLPEVLRESWQRHFVGEHGAARAVDRELHLERRPRCRPDRRVCQRATRSRRRRRCVFWKIVGGSKKMSCRSISRFVGKTVCASRLCRNATTLA